jgi:hypothetical protein
MQHREEFKMLRTREMKKRDNYEPIYAPISDDRMKEIRDKITLLRRENSLRAEKNLDTHKI